MSIFQSLNAQSSLQQHPQITALQAKKIPRLSPLIPFFTSDLIFHLWFNFSHLIQFFTSDLIFSWCVNKYLHINTLKDQPCIQVLSRPWIHKKKIQGLSRMRGNPASFSSVDQTFHVRLRDNIRSTETTMTNTSYLWTQSNCPNDITQQKKFSPILQMLPFFFINTFCVFRSLF